MHQIIRWSVLLAALWPGAAAGQAVRDTMVPMEDGLRLFATIVGPGTPSLVVPGRFIVLSDYRPLTHGRTILFYDMRNRGAA